MLEKQIKFETHEVLREPPSSFILNFILRNLSFNKNILFIVFLNSSRKVSQMSLKSNKKVSAVSCLNSIAYYLVYFLAGFFFFLASILLFINRSAVFHAAF